MADEIPHIRDLRATDNALYGETSNLIKQRDKMEADKEKKSLRSQPLLQPRRFLPSLLFCVCFPSNGADRSHEITAQMCKMIKISSPERCNQAHGFEGDECGQDDPSRGRDDFLQFAR